MAREKDRIFELAQKISQKKGLKKTIKEYQRIIEEDPTDFKTRVKLGDVYLRRGELAKAIEEYFLVGEYYIREELDLKAIAIFKKILVLNPKMIESYYKLADLYYKRGLSGEAKVQYQKVLKINPKDRKAREGLKQLEKKMAKGSALGKRIIEDKTRESDPVWNTILQELQRQLSAQLRDDDYQAHYHLGIAFKEMGLLDKAIEEFKSALTDPNLEFDGYLMMGMCHREMGGYDKAIEYFRKGLRIKGLTNKQYEHIYYQLGLTFEECGQTENALEAFNKVNELKGSIPSPEFQSKVRKLKEQLQSG
ncbi:MAG: tetratricopeptide repeat protein [Deltaproteobacteria bacterium]|nr:tetratricopeptide repeat protein [Deltaproteobacteria bacterium]